MGWLVCGHGITGLTILNWFGILRCAAAGFSVGYTGVDRLTRYKPVWAVGYDDDKSELETNRCIFSNWTCPPTFCCWQLGNAAKFGMMAPGRFSIVTYTSFKSRLRGGKSLLAVLKSTEKGAQ